MMIRWHAGSPAFSRGGGVLISDGSEAAFFMALSVGMHRVMEERRGQCGGVWGGMRGGMVACHGVEGYGGMW